MISSQPSRPFRSRCAWFAAALALWLQLPGPARAGELEVLNQLALHPSDPDVMAVRYLNGGGGVLFSEDAGKSWKLLCLAAVDPTLRGAMTIGFAGDGRLLLGAFGGLYQDRGGGCDFAMEASMEGRWITDIAPHPTDPNVSFVLTSTANGAQNGVVQRAADGTFRDIGQRLVMQLTGLRVVDNGGRLRFYEGAVAAQVPVILDGGVETLQPLYVIRVSDDDAQTFREHEFGTLGSRFRLLDVDPTDPDRIVAVIDHDGRDDELLVSRNQGETFESYLELSQFGALAFAPDGRVFIGEARIISRPGAPIGLWSAPSLDGEPQKLSEYSVHCLEYQAATDTLFACQPYSLGTVDPSSGGFAKLIDFASVQSFVSCEGMDMPATCEPQLCRDYCGPGHFAQAPVCVAYKTQFCGPCVIAISMGATSCGVAGIGGVGASAGSPAAGASGGTGGSDPELDGGGIGAGRGGPEPDAGSGGGGGGGCDCTARPGGRGSAPIAIGWFVIALCALLALRRRR